MTLLEYGLLATSSLFVIVDPFAVIPAFLASMIMTVVLIAFALIGRFIFQFLGITLPAFQIAGSIILMLVALDMLRAQRSRVNKTKEETEAGAHKLDIAITPLAVPMLAWPGAISTPVASWINDTEGG